MMKKWLFPFISAAAAAVLSILAYPSLPARMAIHFNASDAADNWASKPLGAFLMPVFILAISLILQLAIRLEKDEQRRLRIEASIGSVMAALSAALLLVHAFILAHNLGYVISASRAAVVIAGCLFILLGNVMPRLPRSQYKWPKLPEATERKAIRQVGRCMLAAGILLLPLVLLPQSYILPLFFLCISAFVIATLVIVFRYRQA